MLRPVAAPGAGIAETPQQFGRIDLALSIAPRQRRKLLARDGSDRIGDPIGERRLFSSTVKRDAATGFIKLSERSVLEGATLSGRLTR